MLKLSFQTESREIYPTGETHWTLNDRVKKKCTATGLDSLKK